MKLSMDIIEGKKNNYRVNLPVTESFSENMLITNYLGIIPYDKALKMQNALRDKRIKGIIPDVLLLLEHNPVFTIGRFRGQEDLIASPDALARDGISVFNTDRGGGITYHGPGQLVGYPILNLKVSHLGVRDYVFKLEEVIITWLSDYGISGHRVRKHIGVWVNGKKVCSIGIHVSHYVTTHGFALNINNDLSYYGYIRPCGLSSDIMTSVAALLGNSVDLQDAARRLSQCFSSVFGLTPMKDLELTNPEQEFSLKKIRLNNIVVHNIF
jgi:lipoate-protein ligase B